MKRKSLVLDKATRPNESFFNEGDIVLLYIEKRSNHYYAIRGGIVINPSSCRRNQEVLEIKVLQIVTRKNQPYYSIPELPFIRRYPYSSIKSAEKFENLEALSEQVSWLNKLMG